MKFVSANCMSCQQKKILKIFLIIIANIIYFSILSWLLPIRFETSDDITMASLVNGTALGVPNYDMIFQSTYYGKILCFLYNMLPKMEWYSILQCAFHILAAAIIVYYIFKVKDKSLKYITLIVFYSFWSLLIARLQFTSTTAFLAFASCLLLLDKHFVAGGGLLIISSLLRFESAGMIGLFMTPAFLYEYKNQIKKYYLPVIITVIIAGLIHITDNQAKLSLGATSIVHNSLRSSIQDNPHAWRAVNSLPSNISEDEYKCFINNFFYDSTVFNEDILRSIHNSISSIPLKYKVKDSINSFIKPNWIIFLLIFLSYFLCILFEKDRFKRVLLVIPPVIWLLILFIISLYKYIKIYVLFASILPIVYYLVVYYNWENFQKQSYVHGIYLLRIYLLMIFSVIFLIEIKKTSLIFKELDTNTQIEILSQTPGKVVALSYHECYMNPFNLRNSIQNKLYGYSFLIHYHNKAIGYFDLLNDHVCIFMDKDDRIGEVICNSLNKHNNIEAQEEVIFESPKYKVISINRASHNE